MEQLDLQISKRMFNSAFLPYLDCDKRFLIMYGGAGSGKSYFIAERYIYRLLTLEKCNVLVVRKVDNTNRDSTFALFKQVINKWGLRQLFKINESDMRINCKVTGNGVIFKGLNDVEILKSVTFDKGELTDIWIEEASEVDETDFQQLNVRLRGKGTKKQIVISFNPINANHWLKKRFFDKEVANAEIFHSTYKENHFLDDEYIAELEAFKETDPYYYDVYCLGRWGVFGKTVFNSQNVNQQLEKEITPIKVGTFLFNETDTLTNIRLGEGDCIKIYKEPTNHPYVIGGDTSGDGSDYFVGQVIDNITGEQVAVLRHQFDEDLYARQMFCLGMYYNTALISIEANFSSYPIKELTRLKYPKQFVRKREDNYTGKLIDTYGFKTTSVTRPIIISELVKIMRETPELIVDKETLDEMLTFVRNEKGKPEAQQGSHDDLVMALAIAYYSRMQQSYDLIAKKSKYTVEMLKDYKKANERDKALLREIWGNPF